MPKLIGFEPSIELEMQFTGLELLHLLYGSELHYDGACKAASMHAMLGNKNGIIIRTMMHLGGSYKKYDARAAGESDMQFLCDNLDAEANISLTWREVDLLCKITEQFNLIGGMEVPPLHFSMDVAAGITMGLRRALNEARINIDILYEQEKLRREKFGRGTYVLSVSANCGPQKQKEGARDV